MATGDPGADGKTAGADPVSFEPTTTCTSCGAPGGTGIGPTDDGNDTDTPAPDGETLTDAPRPGATCETGTSTGPTVTVGGTVTVTVGGEDTGTETGPMSSADAASAQNHVAAIATEHNTPVRILNGSHPPVRRRR